MNPINISSAGRLIDPGAWADRCSILNKRLESADLVNLSHAEQLLCDATLSGSPCADLGLEEAFIWWEQCLLEFCEGGYPVDPLMPREALLRVRGDLELARRVYALIDESSEASIDAVLRMAAEALKENGSQFLIPIVYKSQSSGKLEALFAEFSRENGKLYVRLLNRGEGIRLHQLLEIRDGKRLYSYCSERMALRDQEMFSPAELGRAWIKQLKGFHKDPTLPEEIYAVFRDVLGGDKGYDARPEMASSPQRSATSLHHLPRILFRHYQLESPERLKRLSFAVKARALFQVLGSLRSGGVVDTVRVREEAAELHDSAAELGRLGILDDDDLKNIHALTETLNAELPKKVANSTVPIAVEASKNWIFEAPKPRKVAPRGKGLDRKELKAMQVSISRSILPDPKELLARLQALSDELNSSRIAEMHALLTHLPLPNDAYWGQIESGERPKILSALRALLQNYGSVLGNMQESELPRAILSVASSYAIADGLARQLEGDPLKLKNFGLDFPQGDELFFFHRREQIERWRAVQEYFKTCNAGCANKVFGYRRGPIPWAVFKAPKEGDNGLAEQHLVYLRQFDQSLPQALLLGRRFLHSEEKPLDGLTMPQSYDDFHYFSATLRRLCSVSQNQKCEDLGSILSSDQIPVLCRYYDEKEKMDYYELLFCDADSLPTERFKSNQEPEISLQRRQISEYSKKAQKVFFPEGRRTENDIMHAAAALDDLPQAAVHAVQKLLRLNSETDYPLCLSELMDFCTHYPAACRHADIRILIEHILLKEGALYRVLRAEGGAERLAQIHEFLREQRQSVAGLESRLEEYLLWQRLTLDVEQLAPKGSSVLDELLDEIACSTASLDLNKEQRAALALHRAYLYSFHPDKRPELLRDWIEARTLRRQLPALSPSWMEGEILRTIELHGAEFQKASLQTVNLPQTFLSGSSPWKQNGDLFECTRGQDHFVLDPLNGYIYCNGIPLGTHHDSPPSKLCEDVRAIIGLDQTPSIVLGRDKVWHLESDPRLRFERRDGFACRAHWFRKGVIGQERDTEINFYKVEDTWLLPKQLRASGNTYWYQSGILMVEEADGSLLMVYDSKDWQGKRQTFGRYFDKDASSYISKECKLSSEALKEMREQVRGAYSKQLSYLAIREIEIDQKPIRWQRAMENKGILAELLIGHSAWIECDSNQPRLLLLDKTNNPAILLTPSDQGYRIRKVSTGAERVALNCLPWSRLDSGENTIAWAKEGVLEELMYPRLGGLHFLLKDKRFECKQLPGFYAQLDEAPELIGLSGQLVLENDAGQRRLLLTQGNAYTICSYSEGRWKAPDNSSALWLVLKMLAGGHPLAALSVLDQIGEEQPLQLKDWEGLAQLAPIKNASHGIGALILQLALRVTELEDCADPKLSLAPRVAFWQAVDRHLASYGQDQSVPLCMHLREEQLRKLRDYPRPHCVEEPRHASLWRRNELHHAVTYLPGGYHGQPLSDVSGHWTKQQLGGNLQHLAAESVKQKPFPAPIDLQLRATIERDRAGVWTHDEHDRLRLYLLERLRTNRATFKQEDLNRMGDFFAEHTKEGYLPSGQSVLGKTLAAVHTTKGNVATPLSPLHLESASYEERPFAALFSELVKIENRALPEENVNVERLLPQSKDQLSEAVRSPLRAKLQEPIRREVPCYQLNDNAKVRLEKAIDDYQSEQERLELRVEELANFCTTLAQRSQLLSPQHPRLTAKEVLILLNPENPEALLERNPFLNAKEIDELLHAAIDYMACGWKISQLKEALTELQEGNREACAAILDKKQTYDPHSCWWRSLYQYMSGNMLRSDPDQSAILEKIFKCLDSGNSDPNGGELQQLYFEFQPGEGKTKILSAITALRCLSRKKTPVFFSLPNLVDICKRDLRTALADYFHKRTEYLGLSLSSNLSNADLQGLLDKLERSRNRPACLVMVPEGYHVLNLEYWKALGTKGCGQRVELLDKILRFFEEQAIFLIDEGHRNKDSLLNANIAIGEPRGIPAVYRALLGEVYRWLAAQPELALQQNGQASLSPEARNGVIRRLLEHMLSLPAFDVAEERREGLMAYLLDKTKEPPEWLIADPKKELRAQWIAQLRGMATSILPFALSLKGMIDHGPSIHPGNELEAPRDHGQLSSAKFELPDIALALTYQGFLQRGLAKEEQFEEVLEQLRAQAETQRADSSGVTTPIEQLFLTWQKGHGIPLGEIRPGAYGSRTFQAAYKALSKHPEIVLRYVSGKPAGQVSVFPHRLISTAAALSYGAAQAITFSATLGMRSQYTYFGADSGYCEDTDFLAKVIRKALLAKNSRVEIDNSQTPEEFVAKHDFKGIASFLDFGGACGARPSHEWSSAFLQKYKELEGTLYAQQQIDSTGKIDEKLLYLQLRDKAPSRLAGSNTKSLRDKTLLRLFGPEDTVGLDLYAKPDAQFVITIGENCCLDDLAQALLRARFFLINVADGHPSQTVRWIVHEKIAEQIRETLNLKGDHPIGVEDILRFALGNLERRLREAIQTRAYQEIDAVYTSLLRTQLRCKNSQVQQALFAKCMEAVYQKMGYDPFEQWGSGCQERPPREVLTAYDQKLRGAYSAILAKQPDWATQRLEKIISETENLIATLPSRRSSDLQARQIQRQHAHTHQRQRTRQQQRQIASKQSEPPRSEASYASKELSIENLKYPLDHAYLRPARQLLATDLLPENLLLTRDTLLTHSSGSEEELWKLRTAKPFQHILVLKAKDQPPLFIGLSQPQAKVYLRQLQQGKKSADFAVGLLDIRGKWTFPMPEAPSSDITLPICRAVCLLNGRLQHPEHLRELAKQNGSSLERLWTQLQQIHIDPIPSWETVLAFTSAEIDPLTATAKSVDALRIALPSSAPNLRNPHEEIPSPIKKQPQPLKIVPAKPLNPLDLARLRDSTFKQREKGQEIKAHTVEHIAAALPETVVSVPLVEHAAPSNAQSPPLAARVTQPPAPVDTPNIRPARQRCWQNLGTASAIGVALVVLGLSIAWR